MIGPLLSAPQNRTALSIVCDTKNIPIYIDNYIIGYTPLPDPIDITPGWHKVSFFPDVSDQDIDTRKISRDILQMGTQDVLVETGETVTVTMTYQHLNEDIELYYQRVHTGTLLGFTMIIAFLSIIVWAYV